MSPITHVTDATFEAQVLNAPGPVLVDFWAPWCGACRLITPILDELAAEQSAIAIAKLDVDANMLIAGRYQVMSLPTLLVFRRGELVDRIVGAVPKATLLERLNALPA